MKMKRNFISKSAVLFLLVLMLCTVFSSCAAPRQQKVTISGVTLNDTEGLTQEEIDAIATFVRNNSGALNDFVAAYRGYDMASENSEDKKLTEFEGRKDLEGNFVVNLTGAKATLAKYDTENTLSYEKLDEEDVKNIVKAMQIEVEFEENRGFFGSLYFGIGYFIDLITNTIGFGNYLIGICVFAIIVELLMLPFTFKQQKNSIKQAKLRPKEMAIRNRYKGRNDQVTQQKVAEEIQALYERENFNPMGGCLPMLVQLPVIMVIYNVVINPIQYILGGTASFAGAIRTYFTASAAAGGLGLTLTSTNGTIEMLSQLKAVDFSSLADFALFKNSYAVFEQLELVFDKIPSFNIGPINFGLTPSFNGNYALLVVPVLTFVVYFFSMKLTKKFTYQAPVNDQAQGQGCANGLMDWYMPLVSVFFSFMVPGAIGIYWVFRSIISTLKQFIMSRVMPIPQFTEEDYKAAERELNQKTPQRKRKVAAAGADADPNRVRPRSLHHIDDDDE